MTAMGSRRLKWGNVPTGRFFTALPHLIEWKGARLKIGPFRSGPKYKYKTQDPWYAGLYPFALVDLDTGIF